MKTVTPYSEETLKRLVRLLEQYQVLPWLNPATNAISIKDFNFTHVQRVLNYKKKSVV